MKLNPNEIKERAKAAMVLLNEDSTSLEKVQSVVGLMKGINKKLDSMLVACEKNCRMVELAGEGAVVELAAEQLPDETEEQKKRKKALLLFIRSWGELKSEVNRIQAELDAGKSVQDSSFWLSALSAAKGPLAVLTLVAIAIGIMSQTSVDIVIQNNGCPTLYPGGSGVSIPGLKLPGEPLVAGQSAVATIPPLSITVDGTAPGKLALSSLVFSFDIELSSSVDNVTYNGTSLLGVKTDVSLSKGSEHTLALVCN